MCGICGVAFSDPRRVADGALVQRMSETIRHRGPDSDGRFLAPGVGLGVRRLSIIDLATGDQPISNEDGSLTLVCNGEIYNFVELRERLQAAGHRFRTASDVEVILHLYEDHGVECVHHLRGMFAFALWDAPRRRLMLARDRIGIKPLQYAETPEALYFGSELKAILASGRVERQLDLSALRDIFTLGFVVGPKTMMTSIRRLQPGHVLLYESGRISLERYWDVSFSAASDGSSRRSGDEWAEAVREKLSESVRIHLRSDVPVGAWLSSGIDSSAVVALASGLGLESFGTLSLAFENPRFDEVTENRTLDEFPGFSLANRRVTCRASDLALLPRAVWHGEDVASSGVHIPQLIMAEASARTVKVVLTGEGSDELFGGYQWFRADKILRPFARLPLAVRRSMLLGSLLPRRWPGASRILLASRRMDISRYTPMVGPSRLDTLDALFSDRLRPLLGGATVPDWDLSLPSDFESWHPMQQLQYYEHKVRLPDFIVHHLDRSSMAHSVEVRVPFLDHELVELCATIPPSLKLRGLTEKHILREAMRPVLPPEINRRRKRGLRAPYAQWMRNPLPEFAAELLSERSLRAKGYFEPRVVERMLGEHRARARDHGDQLIGILAVQLWDDLFMQA